MSKQLREYALYRGDEFIDIGTSRYLSDKYSISQNVIRWYAYSSSCKKRNIGKKYGMVIIPLGVDSFE